MHGNTDCSFHQWCTLSVIPNWYKCHLRNSEAGTGMPCSLLIFSDWLISLLYERLKGSVPGVCLLWSPESLVISSYVEAHAFTLSAHTWGNTETVLGGDLDLQWQLLLLWRVTGNWVMHFPSDGTFLPMCACDTKGNLSLSHLFSRRSNLRTAVKTVKLRSPHFVVR